MKKRRRPLTNRELDELADELAYRTKAQAQLFARRHTKFCKSKDLPLAGKYLAENLSKWGGRELARMIGDYFVQEVRRALVRSCIKARKVEE